MATGGLSRLVWLEREEKELEAIMEGWHCINRVPARRRGIVGRGREIAAMFDRSTNLGVPTWALMGSFARLACCPCCSPPVVVTDYPRPMERAHEAGPTWLAAGVEGELLVGKPGLRPKAATLFALEATATGQRMSAYGASSN